MAGVDRIVKRATLKAKLANLESQLRANKVIAAAQNMLHNVSREGFAAGYKAREEEYQREAAENVAGNVPAVDNLSLTDKVQL
jgi:AmiR/NasT family two-component response regulator